MFLDEDGVGNAIRFTKTKFFFGKTHTEMACYYDSVKRIAFPRMEEYRRIDKKKFNFFLFI